MLFIYKIYVCMNKLFTCCFSNASAGQLVTWVIRSALKYFASFGDISGPLVVTEDTQLWRLLKEADDVPPSEIITIKLKQN